MTLERKAKGDRGEADAVKMLRDQGYRIVETNWRFHRGEVDIIASQGNTLVFVEVKSGSSRDYGPPELRVTRAKQRQLGRLAQAYLQQHAWKGDCRFDVIAVSWQAGRRDIKHYKEAFWLE